MEEIAEIDEVDWQIQQSRLIAQYNRLCTEFKNTVDAYYRQGLFSAYVNELDLVNKLRELKDIKTKVMEIKENKYTITNIPLSFKREY